tara:strand:- start:1462 stop:1803 length:342 start_codon:yes stop_codon:yes gene_type:complete
MVHNRRTRVRRKKRCNSTIKKGGKKGETLYVNRYQVFDIKSDNEKCKETFVNAKQYKYNVFVFVKQEDNKWNTNLILAKPPSEYDEEGTNAGQTYENSRAEQEYCVAMLITRY